MEKVCRLTDILVFMNAHPLMKARLALKGGTAINLTVFNLPRLSVDIDLDYSVDIDRTGMIEERKIISQDLLNHLQAQGYELSEKSKSRHSLDSSIFTYINSAGVHDNIKIKINHSMRVHILPLVHRKIVTSGIFDETAVLAVPGMELFGSKIKALLDREAARDLYDISNMIRFGLFDESEREMLKKCALFNMAVGNDRVPEQVDVTRIDDITFHKIHTEVVNLKNMIILYQSKYGATKKYAQWLSNQLGCESLETKSAKINEIEKYDVIILGGGIYASGIAGLSFIRKNHTKLKGKKVAVFAVGASPYDNKAMDAIKAHNFKKDIVNIPCFYCRGAWNENAMTFKDKMLCNMLKVAVSKKEPSTYEPWETALMEAIGSNVDWTNKEYLAPILEYVRAE